MSRGPYNDMQFIPLTAAQWIKAVHMWREGKDTADIAAHFQCPEWLIYRDLPEWRKRYRLLEGKAA